MITLTGLIETLRTTRNFWNALALAYSKGRKAITLWNGSTFLLTWLEYVSLREILLSGHSVTQVRHNVLRIRNDKVELFGSSDMLPAFCELQDGVYDCDCRGKIVLDVGGFKGESAVFFSAMGAKKVVIYEPVAAHQEFIKKNVAVNRIDAELHEEGIGDEDGTQVIRYETTNQGFGILSKGQKEMEIRIRNAASVIEESNADVAKFDCEGGEECLARVPSEVIRKIEYYIIEVHTLKIREEIMDKYKLSGFDLVKEIVLYKPISVIHFKKNTAML